MAITIERGQTLERDDLLRLVKQQRQGLNLAAVRELAQSIEAVSDRVYRRRRDSPRRVAQICRCEDRREPVVQSAKGSEEGAVNDCGFEHAFHRTHRLSEEGSNAL